MPRPPSTRAATNIAGTIAASAARLKPLENAWPNIMFAAFCYLMFLLTVAAISSAAVITLEFIS